MDVSPDRSKPRVLVTGANGTIGRAVIRELGAEWDLRALVRREEERPVGITSHVADLADLDALRPAFDGLDAVVHLAAASQIDAPWETVLSANLIGAYHAYEAARRADVRRFVFASTSHVVGEYEIEWAPELYRLDDPRVVDEEAPIRPDSLYGVSKAYGEALGRHYAERYGMEVVCLRIGWVTDDDDPAPVDPPSGPEAADVSLSVTDRYQRLRAMWLSQRDSVRLIERAVEAPGIRYAIVYGTSDNPRQFLSLRDARELLGFVPRDRAPLDPERVVRDRAEAGS
jgi:NAD+ dependent glucose-6-phosphate dehydrogenase